MTITTTTIKMGFDTIEINLVVNYVSLSPEIVTMQFYVRPASA